MDPEYNLSVIINNLKTNLKKYYIDSKELFNLLKKYNAYMIGSFLLSAIMGKSWADNVINYNDINICIIGDHNNDFENESKFGFLNCETTQSWLRSIDIISISTTGIYIQDESRSLNIRIFYINKEKHNNISSFINLFDVDICRNYFDGENLFIENYSNIKNSIAIMNVQMPFFLNHNQIDRIKIHNVRGFNIKINYDDKLYTLKYRLGIDSYGRNKLDITSAENLMLILDETNCYNYDYVNILNNLPENLEFLQIYLNNETNYDYINNINFPISLKNVTYIDLYNKYVINKVNPKLPFGCKFILKNDLFIQ